MKPLLHFRLLFVIALCIGLRAPGAEEKPLEGEALGKISLGQKADALGAQAGKPESKGKDVLWEAIGEWVQEWRFPAQGLTVQMSSVKKGGAKSVLSLSAESPCKLATSRGIKIGSTEAEVTKAYRDVRNAEQSIAGQTFVAGSIYGGAIFTIKAGKIVQIFIGAAAE